MTENEALEILIEVGSQVPMTEVGRLIWMEVVNKVPPYVVEEATNKIAVSRMDIQDTWYDSVLGKD